MTWEEAKQEIKKHVRLGTDVNTVKSSKNGYRKVKCVCDWGYVIPKGKKSPMNVTWDMLETCWNGMVDNKGVYDNTVFGEHYPKITDHAYCYVHTVGKIFEKAGLVNSVNDNYYLLK